MNVTSPKSNITIFTEHNNPRNNNSFNDVGSVNSDMFNEQKKYRRNSSFDKN